MAPGQAVDRNGGVCNHAVESFVNKRHLDAHKRNMSIQKPLIQNKWSNREEERIQASRRNVKREQMQDDRYANIERENYRLLNRMGEIERRTPAKAAAQLSMQFGGVRGAVRSSSVPSGAGSKANARVREMRRIDFENQRMLKRLQGAKASVDLNKFDQAYSRQQKVMRMRCEHIPDEEKEAARQANAAVRERMFSDRNVEELMDPEVERLLRLQDEFRRRAADDEEELEEEIEGEEPVRDALDELQASQASRPGSSSSSRPGSRGRAAEEGGSKGPSAEAVRRSDPALQMPTFAGVIPENSRRIVEELMANHALQAERDKDAEIEAEEAKEAAARALRAAACLDVASTDLVLGYGNMVTRSSKPAGLLDF